MTMNQAFRQAQPVWLQGLEKEKNITCGLYCAVGRPKNRSVLLLAAAGEFRVFVNGNFIAFGPTRCAHGFFRITEVDLFPHLTQKINHIAVEVHNPYIKSFAVLKQPGFIQAELLLDGAVLAYTGVGGGFTACNLTHRIRRMQRFSYQRAFGESYRQTEWTDNWRIGQPIEQISETLVPVGEKALLTESVPAAVPARVFPQQMLCCGIVHRGEQPAVLRKDRSLIETGDILEGYSESELELHLSDEIQSFQYDVDLQESCELGEIVLTADRWAAVSFSKEKSGFIGASVECLEDGILYVMVDETLRNGDIDPLSMECLNVVKWELKRGKYNLKTFEVYGFRYLKWVCIKGCFRIENTHLDTCEYPYAIVSFRAPSDSLQKIWDAAEETFRQNSPDIFMDCPTRERAGWLCDSFFTARAEFAFTGQNRMERFFLQNFILPEHFEGLPEGMLPMSYPSDSYIGQFIPNWAMWFVLELADYRIRTGDNTLAKQARKRVMALLGYFERFENEYGLLEKLENWVFVEWSKANDLVQDVNFPTNMLYAEMLRNIGELYHLPALQEKADKLKQTIRELSFDGMFFRDRAFRKDNGLWVGPERTETCQYYAFFTQTVVPQSEPLLWKILVENFGPLRQKTELYSEIYSSNAFIGNYLRLDCLVRYGLGAQALQEMKPYFGYMADTTGTLWENIESHASCNHGFASYVAYLMKRALAE